MEEIRLEVQIREELGSQKIKKIRRDHFLPAIVYGEKQKPTPIKVDRRAYEKIMRQHRGESVLFHINVLQGEKKLRDYSAIVKEEQHDPVTDEILHVDFNRISLKEKIEVEVPIRTKGEPIGVKRDNGSLDHHIWELDVICLPTDIPQHLDVNVEQLEIGDSIYVRDLKLPAGVVTEHDPEDIVVTVVPPMKEEVPTEQEGIEPEVIGEKKAGEEGEESADKAEAKGEEKAADAKAEKKSE